MKLITEDFFMKQNLLNSFFITLTLSAFIDTTHLGVQQVWGSESVQAIAPDVAPKVARNRRIVDEALKCIVHYNEKNEVVKVDLRDPNSKIKVIIPDEIEPKARKILINKLHSYLLDVCKSGYDPKNPKMICFIENIFFNFDKNKQILTVKNNHLELLRNSQVETKFTCNNTHIVIEKFVETNIHKVLFENDSTKLKKNIETLDSLIKGGVSLTLLQKYFPPEEDESYLPIEFVENTIRKIVLDQLNQNQGPEELVNSIYQQIENHTAPELGKRKLSTDLNILQFPLHEFLFRLMGYQEYVQKNKIEASLQIANNFSNSAKDSLTKLKLAKVASLGIDAFLEQKKMSDDSAKDLLESFFQNYPQLENVFKQSKIPYGYYFAKYFLKQQLIDTENDRKRINDFLSLIKSGEFDLNEPSLDLQNFAKNERAKLVSYEVHKNFAKACSKDDKCCVLKEYLTLIDKADRSQFTQEQVNNNIGALALGDGGTFDFDIITNDSATCDNLLFEIARKHKILDPKLDEIDVPEIPNCSIIENMADLLVQINELTKIMEDKNNTLQGELK